MRDVVIIGGGLSGLAAAVELEKLAIPYRLIEVKNRLGGSIATLHQDGFTFDTGAFAFPRDSDWSFLAEYGLQDALIPVNDHHLQQRVIFRDGTQTLTGAMAARVQGTVIHRMAVSSLGELEGRYVLCLENGLMWDASALIIAAPARHAERMLRTLAPEAALRLFNYGYDTVTRLSLGYPSEAVTDPGRRIWGDMATAFYYTTDHPGRAPTGHTLIHLGVRFPLLRTTPEILVRTLQEQLGWPTDAVFSHVSAWSEADPLPPHSVSFHENMAALAGLLPEGVALTGSDFNGLGLAERIAGGRDAARKVARWLNEK